MGTFMTDAIKLGPEPVQTTAKPPPKSSGVVEVSSKEWQQKKKEELEAKREQAKELRERLSFQESRLNERLGRLGELTRNAEGLKQKIERKKQDLKETNDYLHRSGGYPAIHDDYRKNLEDQIRDKDMAIRSFSQQGGKDAEAKIAKVIEAKNKLLERIEDTGRKLDRDGIAVERVKARKDDIEREINALKQELVLVEAEILEVAGVARNMSVDKMQFEQRVQEAEKEIHEIESYFGWIETRHIPKIGIKTQTDPDSVISHVEAMQLRRITRLAEIEKEIEEMEKESEGKG